MLLPSGSPPRFPQGCIMCASPRPLGGYPHWPWVSVRAWAVFHSVYVPWDQHKGKGGAEEGCRGG